MGFERNELIDLMMVFPRKMTMFSRSVTSKYLEDSRIKPYHLMMIHGIGMNDGISQKDLVEMVPFDKSYISTGVRELMDMGFVYNDSEGKIHNLRLTQAGRDIMAMGNMMFDLIESSMFSTLTSEERETLIRIMRKVNDHTDDLIEQMSK